ncbi:nuclear movement protein nudC [Ceraceosorus guamensis]|uniref:Nuclear movement protein nudC n=1 Tax=Ceraceosorus guamensis TaxID=1522189 RepID=A0A316W3Y7_9BASI|nr:nuclear movement protein nudC [Ceraceosorus guamensis]PWN42315.1 nuclear movement protein nudC [Ceraceosorus guamensis]
MSAEASSSTGDTPSISKPKELTASQYDELSVPERQAYDSARAAAQAAEQEALPYKWDQTLQNISVLVDFEKGTRAKELDVVIKRRSIKVGRKGKEPVFSGELFKDVVEDDSTWSLEDSQTVSIHLEKQNQSEWWPHVVTSAPKIDTTKLVPENSKLSDLDGETRAMVEKMMFDNRQKALGKPTSDQLKQSEALDKFKQQHPEMDFSNAKVNF